MKQVILFVLSLCVAFSTPAFADGHMGGHVSDEVK